MKLLPRLGWLIFAFVIVSFLAKFGSHWEFGRYGTPRSLVTADGRHYADGQEIDPMTEAIIKTGKEEEASLVVCCLLLALFVWVGWSVVSLYRALKRQLKVNVIRQLIQEKSDEGQWDDVEELRQMLAALVGGKPNE